MKKVICLGDNCVDYYDETGEAFYGGNPVNVSVYLRRLGKESSYLGAVGTDKFGRKMKEAISGRGVDVSHLKMQEGTTAVTHVTIRNGDRVLGDYDEGVMAEFSLEQADFDFIAQHQLAVSGLWGHCENDLKVIQRLGVKTAFDCADRPDDPAALIAIPAADVIFFSDDADSDERLMERIRKIREMGAKVVVATRGEKGSLAYDGERFYSFGIVPCKVVDTMGAGDSYIAGFLAAWLEGDDIAECMRAGAACSAVTLGYSGAW